MPIAPHIQIDGLRELQAAIKKQQGQRPKALGEAHKEIGRFVIAKLPPGNPNAVGAGAGATVRPSATKREVLLRVGGAHREGKKSQWGKRPVQPFVSGRPYIIQTVEANEAAIIEEYKEKVIKVLAPAFHSAD